MLIVDLSDSPAMPRYIPDSSLLLGHHQKHSPSSYFQGHRGAEATSQDDISRVATAPETSNSASLPRTTYVVSAIVAALTRPSKMPPGCDVCARRIGTLSSRYLSAKGTALAVGVFHSDLRHARYNSPTWFCHAGIPRPRVWLLSQACASTTA